MTGKLGLAFDDGRDSQGVKAKVKKDDGSRVWDGEDHVEGGRYGPEVRPRAREVVG